MLKTFPWEKITVTKNALLFSRAPTHHSYNFIKIIIDTKRRGR